MIKAQTFLIAASSDESSYDYLTDYEDSDEPEFETSSQFPSSSLSHLSSDDETTSSDSEASGSQMSGSGSVDGDDDDNDPILSSDEEFDV